METLKLKNGTEEALPLVRITMLSLSALIEKNPIAFYELVMKCRNQNHKFFGNTADELVKLSLVTESGRLTSQEVISIGKRLDLKDGDSIPENIQYHVHDSIRNIVLSAVEGEGLSMKLTNPIAA